jgi:hypothetical protein
MIGKYVGPLLEFYLQKTFGQEGKFVTVNIDGHVADLTMFVIMRSTRELPQGRNWTRTPPGADSRMTWVSVILARAALLTALFPFLLLSSAGLFFSQRELS